MILITGACGRLGGDIARRLQGRGRPVRLTDLPARGEPGSTADFRCGDLSDLSTALSLAQGCSAILHFAGMAVEASYDVLETANLRATHNIFEAARLLGCRVIYASSHHVIGFHDVDRELGVDASLRPDTLYGVSKAYGELLSSLYWDKHGVESACLRIGSWEREPLEPRHLRTWLSHEDLERLVLGCLDVERLGRRVIWGVSNNADRQWRDSEEACPEPRPRDDAEAWRESFGPDLYDGYRFHGGRFCDVPAFEPEDDC